MLSLYYRIWADVVTYHKERKGNEISWKPFAIVAVSTLQGINLLALLLLLRIISGGQYLVIFPMHIFNIVGLNTMCSILLTYFAPFIIINYLVLFYNDRYKEALKPYPDAKGKLYRNYALISIGIIVIPLIIKLVFF